MIEVFGDLVRVLLRCAEPEGLGARGQFGGRSDVVSCGGTALHPLIVPRQVNSHT